jgi:hypothetical protein
MPDYTGSKIMKLIKYIIKFIKTDKQNDTWSEQQRGIHHPRELAKPTARD